MKTSHYNTHQLKSLILIFLYKVIQCLIFDIPYDVISTICDFRLGIFLHFFLALNVLRNHFALSM